MKGLIFLLLGMILIAFYVLGASHALEFKNKTLGETDTVQRIAYAPVFYPDRLIGYFRDQWKRIRQMTTDGSDRHTP